MRRGESRIRTPLTEASLASETDARGVTVARTTDELDRVVFVDYPENALASSYSYDDPGVPFSQGRLTSISRSSATVDYAYDRFGRLTQDGALTYSYDLKSNRTSIGYPGGVSTTTSYDFADRESTLTLADGTTTQPIVTSASYLPSGPLTSLALGNGLVETRDFDTRYFPTGISVPGRPDWDYATDAVGNILSIMDGLDASQSRRYGYQDHLYLADRPVAAFESVLETDAHDQSISSTRLLFLTTDHLGTPILATDSLGEVIWDADFEPFGASAGEAAEANIFLRKPGQWQESTWDRSFPGSGLFYNVHRWYEPRTGRYTRPDPAGLRGGLHLYSYARSNPLRWVDRLGLQSTPPPPPTRDPFVPPFDPTFPSGPWGERPDPDCCDEDQIQKGVESADRQLETLASGGVPSGTIGGAITIGHFCQDDGWCRPEGPSPTNPFNPFVSPETTDPCVRFCTRVHEWYHYSYTRWWSMHWDEPTYSNFSEGPAYGLSKACLQSFTVGN